MNELELLLKEQVDEKGYYMPEKIKAEFRPQLMPTELLQEREQYRFHFDMTRCVGCECCVVACNEQNNNPASVNWRRVGEIEWGSYPDVKQFHLSMACNHCLDPACLTGCPTDAYLKLSDGIVQHQAQECIGCGYCTWNCPYGVPQFNSERNIVTKCDMCHSRLSHGQLPACAAACPQQAIQIEKVNVHEWRREHQSANAPGVPDAEITISTTRITLPHDIPQELLQADRHRMEPEHPHTSLIFMTVLTQLAVGGFITIWLGNLLSNFMGFLKPLNHFLVFGAFGMLTVTGIALFAAIFHLGRPLYAYKALRMWRRSWLSREVLLFSLFSMLGSIYAILQLGLHVGKISNVYGIDDVLGAVVILLGIAGVYASAKIYMVPARPAWNTIRTPLRFFLTGWILGPLFSLFIYALYLAEKKVQDIGIFYQGPLIVFLIISAIAGLAQLGVLLGRFFHLRASQSRELFGSTFLLVNRFRNQFLTRIGLLMGSCFLIPLIFFYLASTERLNSVATIRLSFLALIFALVGEFLGRYLFFVTVVPKNISGSFFSAK